MAFKQFRFNIVLRVLLLTATCLALFITLNSTYTFTPILVAGLIIYLTGRLFWLDSALSILIAAVITVGAVRLLRDVMQSLRTGQPLDLND